MYFGFGYFWKCVFFGGVYYVFFGVWVYNLGGGLVKCRGYWIFDWVWCCGCYFYGVVMVERRWGVDVVLDCYLVYGGCFLWYGVYDLWCVY